jgi:ribosomal protein S18 acetylase RimI-like enzyme
VDASSLGYRTDLMVRLREGSQVEDRGDCLVVRSPRYPTFWWGNFLLVPSLGPGAIGGLLDRFAAEFPGARHVAIGVEDLAVNAAELTAMGLSVDRSAVLTAGPGQLRPPPRPNGAATYRELSGDAEWEQVRRLREIALIDEDGVGSDPAFVRGRVMAERAMCEAGLGTWHGAFLGGDLVAQMGVVADPSSGLARYQNVETHPGFRRLGLAGTLTWHAGCSALASLAARAEPGQPCTLVIVADPDDVAIRVYRSLGFTDTEPQVGLARPPADA